MQLTVLGCWSPYPIPGGACSGYLIEYGETSLMLDAGNGSFSQLQKHIDYSRLAAVIVTHLHPDHYLDLFCLRHAITDAIRDGRRPGPLALFLPQQPAAEYQELSRYTDAFIINPIERLPLIDVGAEIKAYQSRVGILQLQFTPNEHPLPAYAVAIDCGQGRLVFSGDTAPTKELVTLANKADLFLCEASGLDQDRDFARGCHLTARQAGKIARDAQVGQLLITHFYPQYDLKTLQAQAAAGFGSHVLLAVEGAKYQIKSK